MLRELRDRTAKKVPFLEIQTISSKRRGHSNGLIYNPILFGALICDEREDGICNFLSYIRCELGRIATNKVSNPELIRMNANTPFHTWAKGAFVSHSSLIHKCNR